MDKLSLDINKTKAILIGVSEYEFLQPIKPAKRSVEDFVKILTNNDLFGLPEKNIKTIVNKRNDEIFDEIVDFLDNVENIDYETLLFYYVGHGIRESEKNRELFLTAVNTKKHIIESSAIRYNTIKERLEKSHWQKRIVIIDACYSGLIAMDDNEKRLTEDEMDIKGTYVLTSAGDEKSFFDTNEKYTFFTGEFLKIIENGTPELKPYLSLDDIFIQLQKNLKQSTPHKKENFNTREFYMFKNKQYDKAVLFINQAKAYYKECDYEKTIEQYNLALIELAKAGKYNIIESGIKTPSFFKLV